MLTLWQWVGLGAAIAVVLSVSVTLVVAAILGNISRDMSRVLEGEAWTLASTRPMRTPAATL